MKLIILQGGGAAGKSSLAKRISESLNIPTFLKDDFKEKAYDQAGGKLSLPDWLRLEDQSYAAINKAIESAISNHQSLIVEGNFPFYRQQNLKRSVGNYKGVIEIDCYAKPWTAFSRYIRRAESSDRHKGHRDRLWYPLVFLEAVCAMLGLRWYRHLKLSKNLLMVDTTKPSNINYQGILNYIEEASGS